MAAATLADGYGDAKNPYASKAKGNVLAAPGNAAGRPSFRPLLADDMLEHQIQHDTQGHDFNQRRERGRKELAAVSCGLHVEEDCIDEGFQSGQDTGVDRL